MALDPSQNRLPCGVELDTLLEQITDHAPPHDPAHQAHCPYCQTALSGFRQGWGDLQTLARAPVPVPPGLTSRIMTRVRTLAGRTAENIILAGSRGHTQINHAVIAQIARRAAVAIPGVLFASAQPTPTQPANPARLNLAIRLVTTYGPSLRPLATAIRAALHQRIPTITGATIDNIEITFTDIAEPDS